MSRTRLLAAAALVAALSFASIGAAGAEEQTLTGTIDPAVTINAAPATLVDFGTFALGENTESGGSMTVSANVDYVLSVKATKATMTSYDSGTSTYGDKALAAPLTILASPDLLSATSIGIVPVGTTDTPIAAGVGLVDTVFGLSLTQLVGTTDAPGEYRNVLTYTASAGTL